MVCAVVELGGSVGTIADSCISSSVSLGAWEEFVDIVWTLQEIKNKMNRTHCFTSTQLESLVLVSNEWCSLDNNENREVYRTESVTDPRGGGCWGFNNNNNNKIFLFRVELSAKTLFYITALIPLPLGKKSSPHLEVSL